MGHARCVLVFGLGLAAATPVAAAPGEEPVTRRYDVGPVLEALMDHPGPSLTARTAAQPGGVGRGDDVDPPALCSADELVELVTRTVAPETWDWSRTRCTVQGRTLEVTHEPSVQPEVARLLASLWRAVGRAYDVRVRVLRAEPAAGRALMARTTGGSGLFAAGTADGVLASVAGVGVLAEATVRVRDGQRAHAAPLRRRTYRHDADAEVATKSTVGDPTMGTLTLGLVADVRAVGAATREGIVCQLQLAWSELPEEPRTVETPLGALDLPEPVVTEAHGVARLGPGEACLLGAAGPAGGGAYFLVSWAARDLPAPPVEPRKSPAIRETRAWPLGELTLETPALGGPGLVERASTGGVLCVDETIAAPYLAGDLADRVRETLDRDSWEQEGHHIEVRDRALLVTHTPAMQARIGQWLEGVGANAAPLVRTEVVLVAADAALLTLTDAPGGGALAAEPVERAIAAAGAAGRVLGHATNVTRDAAAGYGSHVRRVSGVVDYDAELAEGTHAADPIVGAWYEGLTWGVVPRLAGDGRGVTLDAQPEVVMVQRPVAMLLTTHGLVTAPVTDERTCRASLVLPLDAWTAIRLGEDPQGRPLLLLVVARRAG